MARNGLDKQYSFWFGGNNYFIRLSAIRAIDSYSIRMPRDIGVSTLSDKEQKDRNENGRRLRDR